MLLVLKLGVVAQAARYLRLSCNLIQTQVQQLCLSQAACVQGGTEAEAQLQPAGRMLSASSVLGRGGRPSLWGRCSMLLADNVWQTCMVQVSTCSLYNFKNK